LRPRVEIIVDELAVHGLPPREARAAASAFEARLAELAIADTSVAERADSFRALPAIDARADNLGEAVAGAVWGEISRGARR
jgi:hypothetical protein